MVVKSGAPGETAESDFYLANGRYYGEDGNNVALASGSVNVTVNNNGGGQSFSIMQPALGMYICIAMTGIYPSRN